MSARCLWFSILAILCQLFCAALILTTQLRAQTAKPTLTRVTIRARHQEKEGSLYHLRGEAEIDYKELVLRADEADYNDDTGAAALRGHVTLDGGPYDEHITATNGSFNVDTETGSFYHVAGTFGYRARGYRVTLTSSSPFNFTGRMVEKVGDTRYIIHHGSITSCELPHPKWRYTAARIVVRLGDKATFYNGAFELKNVPVFFLPYGTHPAERLPRQSGFLLPSFGTSSRKGFMLGDAFYWAINRSMDATLGAELWSSRGYAQHGEFRARPSDDSYIESTYFGVLDRGGPNHVDESGEDIRISATDNSLFWGMRGVLSANYLSSFAFRQTWAETFAQAINSEVYSAGFLSKDQDGYSLNLIASRYQNFQSTQPGDSVIIQRLPALEAASVDRSFGDSRFFWSFDSSLGGLTRSEPGFETAGLTGRFDAQPALSYSWAPGGWTLRPEIAFRNTLYTEQLQPGPLGSIGSIARDLVNRYAVEGSFELRPPALHRIFEKPFFGQKIKHTIEPRVVYRYVAGVHNFPEIIRFDERDILSDTDEVELALVNRFYGKRLLPHCEDEQTAPQTAASSSSSPNSAAPESASVKKREPLKLCPGETPRELLSWEVGQKIFFDRDFGGALVPGRRNVFTTTDDFTGIAFLTDPRRISPVISRLALHPSYSSAVQWDLDYDTKKGRITSSSVFFNYYLRNYNFAAGHTYLVTPGEVVAPTPIPIPSVFNQYRLSAGYGNGSKRGLSSAISVGFDVQQNFLQYTAIQGTYNWDCCGITTEFRRFALGALRNENEFRFAFTLANVGSFGNLKRNERLY